MKFLSTLLLWRCIFKSLLLFIYLVSDHKQLLKNTTITTLKIDKWKKKRNNTEASL